MKGFNRVPAFLTRKLWVSVGVTLVWFLSPTGVLAKGDVASGEIKSQQCVSCHGEGGASTNPEWPKLSGQNTHYFVKQLQAYKKGPKGKRNNELMYAIALNLTQQDMEDLAAYYASEPTHFGKAKASLVEEGQRLYRGGDRAHKISACMACHGPKGKGNGPAAFPAVRGQHAKYSEMQLKAFQNETRSNDPNAMMRDIAKLMTPAQMVAVSSYMEGLR